VTARFSATRNVLTGSLQQLSFLSIGSTGYC